ncbi:MAG: BrxA/BrxB family bacilliredoxin [Blastocatellia bacterium]|nr:BrxA/BrxB family bacilliredoxin [Blastocatellia bacterium]
MYPEMMVAPMRAELTRIGFEEMKSSEDVDRTLQNSEGTVLVVVNSICGCAAGKARPGIAIALQNTSVKPDKLTTVFAGQDTEATSRARSYFEGMPPSSPSIALMKDGELAYMMHRSQIEGRDASAIAADLIAAFEQHCSKN